MTLGTQTKESPGKSTDKKTGAPVLPSLKIPDIQDILDREKLESLEQVIHLRGEIDRVKADWENRLAAAPNQDTFKQYQTRANNLKKGSKGISGALTMANDLKTLQKDVSRDLKQLQRIQKDFDRDKASLKIKLDQLRSAPQQDMDRILNTYSLSADGLGNVSQLLFGDKIGGTVQKAIFWYGKLNPLLTRVGPGNGNEKGDNGKPERGKGVQIHFKEASPLPDLLARQVGVSMRLASGEMQGELRHVTTDQAILGLPLEFNFSGDKLKDLQSITIQGSLDHIDPNKATDQLTLAVQAYRVTDLKLSSAGDMAVTLKNGLAHLNLKAAINAGILDAGVDLVLDAAALEAGNKNDGNHFQQALQSALADISSFSVKAKVTGPLDDYKITMTSDLDKVLKNALGKQIKNLTTEFQDKLRAGITEKIKGPMAEASGSMSGLAGITQEISSRLDLGNNVLNKQLNLGL